MKTDPRTGARFALQLSEFAQEAGQAVDEVVRQVTFRTFVGVVKKSPVDTGRFRGNWQLSDNPPTSSVQLTARLDKSGQLVIELARVAVQDIRAGGVSYITNGLPYGPRLEYGWSKQAPSGMVRLTVNELQKFMREAVAQIRASRQAGA